MVDQVAMADGLDCRLRDPARSQTPRLVPITHPQADRDAVLSRQDAMRPAGANGHGHPVVVQAKHFVPHHRWARRIKELLAFKQEFGHVDVPQKYPPNPSLGHWVTNVRSRRKHGKLHPELAKLLQGLGFRWAIVRRVARRWDWQFMLAQLAEFKKKHGHCRAPRSEDPSLAAWIHMLRTRRKKGGLAPQQIAQLDSLGFEWEPQQRQWEKMFLRLVQHKAKYGNCDVPAEWPEDPSLGHWVAYQRCLAKRGQLPRARVERLAELGFTWNQYPSWEANYAALVQYRQTHGHCRVSTLDKSCSALGNWVRTQRVQRRQGRLSTERIQRLDELEFAWEVPRDLRRRKTGKNEDAPE